MRVSKRILLIFKYFKMHNIKKISDKKIEIINAVYKSKDGLTSNELLEYLNELVALCFHCERPKKFEQIVKENTVMRGHENYALAELIESANIYAEQTGDQYYHLFTKPLKELKPLEDLWRKENSPDKFRIPDATKFYKWIRVKLLGS